VSAPGTQAYTGSNIPVRSQVDTGAVGMSAAPIPGTSTGSTTDYSTLQAQWDAWLQAQGLPALQAGQIETGNLQDQLALLYAQQGLSSGDLSTQEGFQLQGLGLDQSQLGVQQGALQRQYGLLPQENALAQQSLAQQTEQAKYGASQATQAANSQWTPTGNFTSIAHGRQNANIQQQLAFQMANIGRQGEQQKLTYNEQIASLGDQQKQLDIMGQRLGLSGEEIRSRLNTALQQLGISTMMSADQIATEIAKVAGGQTSILGSGLNDILTTAGITIPAGGLY
jgi:hypothetical protein